jgi:hypothetical protein
MIDFDRIRAVKKDAQARLRSIPGVHAVGIGAKVVGGERTTEPAIIVFVVRKKSPSEIQPAEMIPAEIDGVKTDVIEADIPRPLAGTLPDVTSYRDTGLLGGIQIQVGQATFGTLGCIAATDEADSKIVAITNHHCVSPITGVPSKSTLSISVSADAHTGTLQGSNTANLQVKIDIVVTPGDHHFFSVSYVTVLGDTLAAIATKTVALINGQNNPGVTATANVANVILHPSQGFSAVIAESARFSTRGSTSTAPSFNSTPV